jgi:hypothetical protein
MKNPAPSKRRVKENGEFLVPLEYAARLREAQELIVHVALEAARLGDGDGINRVKLQNLIGRGRERIAAIFGHDWIDWPPTPVQLELPLDE